MNRPFPIERGQYNSGTRENLVSNITYATIFHFMLTQIFSLYICKMVYFLLKTVNECEVRIHVELHRSIFEYDVLSSTSM